MILVMGPTRPFDGKTLAREIRPGLLPVDRPNVRVELSQSYCTDLDGSTFRRMARIFRRVVKTLAPRVRVCLPCVMVQSQDWEEIVVGCALDAGRGDPKPEVCLWLHHQGYEAMMSLENRMAACRGRIGPTLDPAFCLAFGWGDMAWVRSPLDALAATIDSAVVTRGPVFVLKVLRGARVGSDLHRRMAKILCAIFTALSTSAAVVTPAFPSPFAQGDRDREVIVSSLRRLHRWCKGIRHLGPATVSRGSRVCRAMRFRADACDLVVLLPKTEDNLRMKPVRITLRPLRGPVRVCRFDVKSRSWSEAWRFPSGKLTLPFDGVPAIIELPRDRE